MISRTGSIVVAFASLVSGAVAQTSDCSRATIPIDAINRSNQQRTPIVTSVREEQLRVEAGGHKARIVSMKPLRTGRVVLVLDKSGSMSDKWEKVQAATLDLATRMPQAVGLGLLVFSDKVEASIPPTESRDRVVQRLHALDKTAAKGHTRLWDSLEQTLGALAPLQAGDALLLITDGGDNLSSTSVGKLKKQLLDAGVRLFAVAITTPSPPTSEERYGALDLWDLATATGGYVLRIENAAELPYSLNFLAGQSLSYYSAELLFDQAPKPGASLRIKLEGLRDEQKHIELAYPRVLRLCSVRATDVSH